MRTLTAAAAIALAALLTSCTDTHRVPTPEPQAAPVAPDDRSH
jgi:hypothetical protein